MYTPILVKYYENEIEIDIYWGMVSISSELFLLAKLCA